jgi:hypothetical protein
MLNNLTRLLIERYGCGVEDTGKKFKGEEKCQV